MSIQQRIIEELPDVSADAFCVQTGKSITELLRMAQARGAEMALEEARAWCRYKPQSDITRGETAMAEELLAHLEKAVIGDAAT